MTDEDVVLLAMRRRSASTMGRGDRAAVIAARTPEVLTVTASGHRQRPYGERRVRKVLNRLYEQGLVERRRWWGEETIWWLSEKGIRRTT